MSEEVFQMTEEGARGIPIIILATAMRCWAQDDFRFNSIGAAIQTLIDDCETQEQRDFFAGLAGGIFLGEVPSIVSVQVIEP